ncbi:MAG: hypothetical protein PHR30_04895 [Gallionellaceae bacterium]|nr:hypothetical protein [Gallionellaceae bacterium]MDD5364655.1 hypothetical protein [Gallionellaceae bacterium]
MKVRWTNGKYERRLTERSSLVVVDGAAAGILNLGGRSGDAGQDGFAIDIQPLSADKPEGG